MHLMSWDLQSLQNKVSKELAADGMLYNERFGCEVFTVGGATGLVGQWKLDVALIEI